jgi:hypothetical protein
MVLNSFLLNSKYMVHVLTIFTNTFDIFYLYVNDNHYH